MKPYLMLLASAELYSLEPAVNFPCSQFLSFLSKPAVVMWSILSPLWGYFSQTKGGTEGQCACGEGCL